MSGGPQRPATSLRAEVRAARGVLRCAPAIFLWVASCAGVASAQTVVVTRAPVGTPVEVVFGADPAGSAVADTQGMATVEVPADARVDNRGLDALVSVDTCGERHKVIVVENGRETPVPEAGCTRQQIPGVFWVQPISTLVIELGGAGPTLLLRQGRFTPPPPSDDENEAPRTWTPVPSGLVLSAGGGFSWLGDFGAVACGNLAECTTEEGWFTYGAGAAFWFNRFLALEAAYAKPTEMNAQGSGTTYRFESLFDADVVSIGWRVGAPVGPARLYGRGGANHQWSVLATTQTVDDRTVTIDGVPTVLPGGTQALGLRTAGWGWYFGGGAEFWMTRWLGTYGEFERAILKGDDRDGGEAQLDDSLFSVTFGVRIHIGR